MTRPVRWLFRIALGLALAGIVLAAVLFTQRDAIIRMVLVSRMRSATGMGVKIASVHVGMRSSSVTIKGLQLYNTPAFGGSLCLDMPELHMEYDPASARSGIFHLPLVRLNLALIDSITDKHGKSNFDSISKQQHEPGHHSSSTNRFAFGGIDTLNLSLGKYHDSNLRTGTETSIDFGLTNQVFHNVKSEADLEGVAVLLAMRGSSTSTNSGIDLAELLNDLIAR